MNNKVIGTVATLGLVLTVGLLTTIYSQQALAQVVTGGNGGDCTQSPSCNGIPGGTAGNGGTNNAPPGNAPTTNNGAPC